MWRGVDVLGERMAAGVLCVEGSSSVMETYDGWGVMCGRESISYGNIRRLRCYVWKGVHLLWKHMMAETLRPEGSPSPTETYDG